MTMAYTEEDYTQASVGLTFAGSTVKANIPVATTGNMGLMPPAMFSKLNDLPTEADLSGIYAKKSDITGVYKYKGSLADATKLPTTGQVAGDVTWKQHLTTARQVPTWRGTARHGMHWADCLWSMHLPMPKLMQSACKVN